MWFPLVMLTTGSESSQYNTPASGRGGYWSPTCFYTLFHSFSCFSLSLFLSESSSDDSVLIIFDAWLLLLTVCHTCNCFSISSLSLSSFLSVHHALSLFLFHTPSIFTCSSLVLLYSGQMAESWLGCIWAFEMLMLVSVLICLSTLISFSAKITDLF